MAEQNVMNANLVDEVVLPDHLKSVSHLREGLVRSVDGSVINGTFASVADTFIGNAEDYDDVSFDEAFEAAGTLRAMDVHGMEPAVISEWARTDEAKALVDDASKALQDDSSFAVLDPMWVGSVGANGVAYARKQSLCLESNFSTLKRLMVYDELLDRGVAVIDIDTLHEFDAALDGFVKNQTVGEFYDTFNREFERLSKDGQTTFTEASLGAVIEHPRAGVFVDALDGMSPIRALGTLEYNSSGIFANNAEIPRTLGVHFCECAACIRAADTDGHFSDFCNKVDDAIRASWGDNSIISRDGAGVDLAALDTITNEHGSSKLLNPVCGGLNFKRSLAMLSSTLQRLSDSPFADKLQGSALVTSDVNDILTWCDDASRQTYERDIAQAKIAAQDLKRDMASSSIALRDVYPRWVGSVGEPAVDAYDARFSVLDSMDSFCNGPWGYVLPDEFKDNVHNELSEMAAKRVDWRKSWSDMRSAYYEYAFPGLSSVEVNSVADSLLEIG